MTKKSSNTDINKKKKKVSSEQKAQSEKSQAQKQSAKDKVKKDITSEDMPEEEVNTEDTTAKKESSTPEDKIQEAEEKAKEWHDKYLRLSAEFDNYRKRTLKEKYDLLRTGNESLLNDILPVVDNFERGLDTIDKSEDLTALKEGIHLIYNMFTDFLKQKGIKEIEAKGQAFDIDFHEALTKIPAPTKKLKGKVVDVIEKGYMLNDKVIRYAKVVVGE